jgi:hypothetical protein
MVHLGCMRQQPFELPANVAFGSKTEVAAFPEPVRCSPAGSTGRGERRVCFVPSSDIL